MHYCTNWRAFARGLLGACLAATPVIAPATPGAPATPAPMTPWTDCRLEHPQRISSVEAQCSSLPVPLDRGEPGVTPEPGTVVLKIARVPALDRRSIAVPLFLLAGGPGQSAIDLYAAFAGAFARVHLNRDIVLVDQRGTGSSSPQTCEFPEDWNTASNTPAEITAATKRCLSLLGSRVRFFTTEAAVHDLEAVRLAMNLGQIDLYAASYGTRVAESYLRAYPDRVQAMILDGVLDPQEPIGPATPLDGERALNMTLSRCVAATACAHAFPQLTRQWQALKARFGDTKIPIELPDPATGKPEPQQFDRTLFGAAFRLMSYSSMESSLVPYMIDQSFQGNVLPLASLAVGAARGIGKQLAVGMQNSVICSEDWPMIEKQGFDRAALEDTYMGTDQLDALGQICALWPRGPVSADLHAPLRSSVPALLLSGEADPVTPPAAAARVAKMLSRSRHLVLAGEGHGQLASGCVPRLMAMFLDRPDPAALDASCLKQHRPAPFFISINGPAP